MCPSGLYGMSGEHGGGAEGTRAGPETNAGKEKFGQKMKLKMKALGEKFKRPKK